jgi:hypothetical protein
MLCFYAKSSDNIASPAPRNTNIKRKQKLSNGHECRLQRNALSVLSHPTGDEIDSEEDDEEELVGRPAAAAAPRSNGNGNGNGAAKPEGGGGGGGGECGGGGGGGGGGKSAKRPTRAPAAQRDGNAAGATVTGKRSERARNGAAGASGTVGLLYKLNPAVTHSLKAPAWFDSNVEPDEM